MRVSPWSYLIRVALPVMLWAFAAPAQTTPSNCELCGKAFGDRYYSVLDKVTDTRRMLCGECVQRPDRCFACGLPIIKDETNLADGRHYCARDAANAILSVSAIQLLVVEAEAKLRHLLFNEMEFPDGNLNVTLVDRVNIEALFALPGNDYHCPNIMGYYQTKTNGTVRSHEVYLLSGLSQGGTRAVFAHELTHAWMADHLPANRRLGGDAAEGFCELIAYLLLKELHDGTGMKEIEANKYTRGQFELFRKAQETYNLQTVIEWLSYGTEPLIPADDIDQVRRAQRPGKAPPRLWINYRDAKTSSGADSENTLRNDETQLRLKAIVGSEKRRIALINNRSFAVGETGTIKLGGEALELRCLEIGVDFVRIETVVTGELQTLHLGAEKQP